MPPRTTLNSPGLEGGEFPLAGLITFGQPTAFRLLIKRSLPGPRYVPRAPT